jgi:hypothetical protein
VKSALCVLVFAVAGLAAAPVQAGGQALGDQAWWSYRDAYRALVRFEKLGSPKHLIQQRVQVKPRSPVAGSDGLQLTLRGERTALELPLDPALHAQVPLLKTAFDDNAALVLNRPAAEFGFRVRVSIIPRPDGLYSLSELRAACAQVLVLQQQLDPERMRGKQCVGVSLAFAPGTTPQLALRRGDADTPLSTALGPLYPGEADRAHPVLQLRWEQAGEDAQLRVGAPPLVIAALIE